MSRLFLGMTRLISGVFGDLVRFVPQGGVERDIQSIFREDPIEVSGADGQIVRIDAPSWRVRRDLAPEARRGDVIVLRDGRQYRIILGHNIGSPAPDAHRIYELQLRA